MTKLLPCPFCGERNIYLNEPTDDYPRGSINCPACLVVMQGEVSGPNRQAELVGQWNARTIEHQHTATRQEVLDQCAEIADAYADENLRMAGDSLLLDPCLSGKGFSPENVAISKQRAIDGCIHSSMHHAARNVAEAIRALKEPAHD